MTDIKSAPTMKEQIKLQAQNEVKKEVMEKAVAELKTLYRKLESAKQVVKNIENEITDYEMKLEGK